LATGIAEHNGYVKTFIASASRKAMTITGASLRATMNRSAAGAVTESRRFEVICEVEPPTRPDLTRVRHQIGVLSHVADSFLIPDNHIGRATVSSVAVAHEVQAMGARGIACLNSRDRNLLGFRRDLLTAAAYGVNRFLYVYGDKPSAGGRTSELTVRAMIEETRAVAEERAGGWAGLRRGNGAGQRRHGPEPGGDDP
jgi:5,10-methylenetetrahydrofolate reductase